MFTWYQLNNCRSDGTCDDLAFCCASPLLCSGGAASEGQGSIWGTHRWEERERVKEVKLVSTPCTPFTVWAKVSPYISECFTEFLDEVTLNPFSFGHKWKEKLCTCLRERSSSLSFICLLLMIRIEKNPKQLASFNWWPRRLCACFYTHWCSIKS